MYFEQKKQNMMIENTEGFAKLITELGQPITEKNVGTITDNILSLIGYFSIDPNRCIDIILSLFQMDYKNVHYLSILKIFDANSLV